MTRKVCRHTDFTRPESLPFHYRDNGRACQRSGGPRSDTGLCPNGCTQDEHYRNDGHEACAESVRRFGDRRG